MRTVLKVNKVWHLRHWDPCESLALRHSIHHGFQERTGLCFCNLLMTSPAFADRRQTGRGSAQCAGVAVEALNPQPHMQLVCKLNRLFGRLLRLVQPVCAKTEQRKKRNQHRYPPHWTKCPFKKFSDHANSWNEDLFVKYYTILLNQGFFVNIQTATLKNLIGKRHYNAKEYRTIKVRRIKSPNMIASKISIRFPHEQCFTKRLRSGDFSRFFAK